MTIKTNGGQFHSKTVSGLGDVETMDDNSMKLLDDIRTDTVDNFVLGHGDWVSQS